MLKIVAPLAVAAAALLSMAAQGHAQDSTADETETANAEEAYVPLASDTQY